MKALIITAIAGITALGASAGLTLNVSRGGVTYCSPATASEKALIADRSLQIAGNIFALVDGSEIWYSTTPVEANTVTVTYDGTSASVVADGALAATLDITVDGTNVTVTQGDVTDEVTYILTGTSGDGSFTLEGSYKATVQLAGLSLTSAKGAPIDIQNGKRIKLNIPAGTSNTLSDTAGGSQKGCIYCKGHLEFTGKGELTVTGNTAHAIAAKEYVTLKNVTLTIPGAVKDGINCTQYFSQESGSITISAVGDDCIQVDYKDSADREEEDTGSFTLTGGDMHLTTSAAAAKCIKAEGDILISGGTITARAEGEGTWDSDKNKTKAAACLSADGDCRIEGGSLDLTATGGGGKGLSPDGSLTVTGGSITIHTSGGCLAYVNNTLYQNYTGNTDRLDSDAKSSPKGIKAKGDILIKDGTFDITVTGIGGEGIESKGTLTIEGGNISINSYDDGINSAGDMIISGGDVTVISTDNDGLDSNSNLTISGGTVRACGSRAPECGIDANEEEGYSVILTGGELIALGGGNSVPSTSASTQPYLSPSITLQGGQTVTITDGTSTLATFTVPEGYTSSSQGGGNRPWAPAGPGGMGGGPGGPGGMGSGVMLSCPGLVKGHTYTVTAGSTSVNVTAN